MSSVCQLISSLSATHHSLRYATQVVQFALAEDAGELGDVTTLSTYVAETSLPMLYLLTRVALVQQSSVRLLLLLEDITALFCFGAAGEV